MTKEALEARRAYKRKWAHEHPESVRRTQEKYWERVAQMQTQQPQPAQEPAEPVR